MIKNIIIFVLAVLCVVLVATRMLEPRPAPTASTTDAPQAVAPRSSPPQPAPPAQAAAPSPLPEPVEQVAAPAPEATPAPRPPAAPQAFDPGGFTDMLERPEFRKAMASQQKMMLGQQYGELFEALALGPEDRDTLKDLLGERLMADMELGIRVLQAGGSSGSQVEELAEARQEIQDRIQMFLGEDDFAFLEQYEATQPERMQVDLFKQGLTGQDQLTWEQEHELIMALHEERMSFPFSMGQSGPPQLGTMPDPEEMERHFEEMAQLNKRLALRADELLTPAQAAQFRENLKNVAAMQEMTMGMAQKMFGGGDTTSK
jgi:hypothetical protein